MRITEDRVDVTRHVTFPVLEEKAIRVFIDQRQGFKPCSSARKFCMSLKGRHPDVIAIGYLIDELMV
ncbi:hypothetical protein B0E33_11490 [Roseibium algicola]|uniref:Uncharacterized protein n=1 Tax=Roseibium algicola TaxID=2857014 RepID=A0ABM6I1B3_9HYPH|nr:hypothetical protein B0E33_11490 [Roseibium aggregatum]